MAEQVNSPGNVERVEFFTGLNSQHYFKRVAANNEEIAASEGYYHRHDAMKAAEKAFGPDMIWWDQDIYGQINHDGSPVIPSE